MYRTNYVFILYIFNVTNYFQSICNVDVLHFSARWKFKTEICSHFPLHICMNVQLPCVVCTLSTEVDAAEVEDFGRCASNALGLPFFNKNASFSQCTVQEDEYSVNVFPREREKISKVFTAKLI